MPAEQGEPTTEARVALTRRPDGQRVVMRQRWEHLLFLHWPVPAEAVQGLLPPGLHVDTFNGTAYIGLVPFTMRDVRPAWSPPVWGLSHFHEVNVRTYVCREDGTMPGVWFFSLDAANDIAVRIARGLWKLPYYYARMRLARRADCAAITYASRRLLTPSVGCRLSYTPTGSPEPAAPGTLPFFLAERYLLYAHDGKRLRHGRVHHASYPLQSAELHHLEDTLVAAAGFPGLVAEEPSPLVHYAVGVSVDVFPLL